MTVAECNATRRHVRAHLLELLDAAELQLAAGRARGGEARERVRRDRDGREAHVRGEHLIASRSRAAAARVRRLGSYGSVRVWREALHRLDPTLHRAIAASVERGTRAALGFCQGRHCTVRPHTPSRDRDCLGRARATVTAGTAWGFKSGHTSPNDHAHTIARSRLPRRAA